jgi:hypothetical protein
MSGKVKTALATAGVGTVAAAVILGGATPAFAKSSETLSGPRVASVRHPFHLAVWVGDDAGAKPTLSRLQVRGPWGGYRWLGTWHKLRGSGGQDPDDEAYSFTVTEYHRGTYTFRAVFTAEYLTTAPVTVVVR